MVQAFVDEMHIQELAWHLDVLLWHGEQGRYSISPNHVLSNPSKHKEQHERIMKADLEQPIHLMRNKGKWLVFEGVERLAKAKSLGHQKVKVRRVVRSQIPKLREQGIVPLVPF